MTHAVTGCAAYVPRYRLAGADIGLRRGDWVVASFDEDSTTMAVAAAAAAIDGHPAPRRGAVPTISSPVDRAVVFNLE